MNHREMADAVDVGEKLKEAGFQVSQLCCSRPSCFNFAARKNDKILLIKINVDADAFSVQAAQELQVIADRLSAASLIISRQAHGKPLEDDTVYSRNSVFVITVKTLKNIVLQTANPLVYAGPGGYAVEVDGKLVEKKRKELGLSIGKLAAMIGVSRRTLYGYEKGMARASVASAYKLAKTLGVPVAKPINIFENSRKHRRWRAQKSRFNAVGKVALQKIFSKFSFCDIFPVEKAPFDFIMNVPREKYVIVGSVAVNGEENIDHRIDEFLSICQVVCAYPVLITEKRKYSDKDVFCVCMDELAEIRTPEDLIASV
ncbi:MAG: helix-turn-helix domain-containing protein [Candidatus Bathyarchaeia archaeon]